MKNILLLLATAISVSVSSTTTSAQCSGFTDEHVMPLLSDFIVSGRFAEQNVSEGQTVEIHRTLSKGIQYRFVGKTDENLPENVEMIVETEDRQTLYASSKNNFEPVWYYDCNETMQVIISVTVPYVSELGERPKVGCLSLLSGIKPLKK